MPAVQGVSPSKRTFDESAFDPALLDMSPQAGGSGSRAGTSAPASPAKRERASKSEQKGSNKSKQKARQQQQEEEDAEMDEDEQDKEDSDGELGDTSFENTASTPAPGANGDREEELTPKQMRSTRGSSTAATATPASTVATPSPAKPKKLTSNQAAAAAAAAGGKSNVFHAVYSHVPVYELMARGIGVMRRRSDSWINATQLLKVAGIDKAKRTKILDKDIAGSGGVIPFEKIQGGYGRYQGTWIPFREATQLAEQYGITELIQPLLDYQPAPEAAQAPLAGLNSSTSSNNSLPPPQMPMALSGGDTKSNSGNARQSAQGPVADVQKQRAQQQQQLQQAMQQQHQQASSSSSVPTTLVNGQSAPTPNAAAEGEASTDAPIASTSTSRKRTRSDMSRSTNGNDLSELRPPVPVKRLKSSTLSPTEQSKLHRASRFPEHQPINNDHRNLLMSLFVPDPNAVSQGDASTSSDIEPTHVIASCPDDLDPDTPIDDHLHTALHWAAALARLPTAKALIQAGSDPARGNDLGETSLMRAVLVTNNFDSETFAPVNGEEGLLNLLAPSLRTLDDADRTVLHHVALVAGIRGRSAAARHYMESILDWIITVEKGNEGDIKTFLNARDANGDTALNIAARVGSRPIVRMLLESGADAVIPNKLGLRPGDFGLLDEGLTLPTEGEMAVDDLQNTPKASTSNLPVDPGTNQPITSSQQSDTILETLQTLLATYATDFQSELSSRSESLERTRNQLFLATKELKDQRSQILSLKDKVRTVELSKWRIKNLERALEEEDKFDWTGRSSITGEPAFGESKDKDKDEGRKAKTSPESSSAVQRAAFEHRGSASTLGALAAVNMPSNIEADPPLPASANASASPSPSDAKADAGSDNAPHSHLTLVQLRRMVVWYSRVTALINARIARTEQNAGEMELDARKVVKLCTGVQEDEEIDNMLSNLINALQSDAPDLPGTARGQIALPQGLDLQRVSAFMAKVRSQELA